VIKMVEAKKTLTKTMSEDGSRFIQGKKMASLDLNLERIVDDKSSCSDDDERK